MPSDRRATAFTALMWKNVLLARREIASVVCLLALPIIWCLYSWLMLTAMKSSADSTDVAPAGLVVPDIEEPWSGTDLGRFDIIGNPSAGSIEVPAGFLPRVFENGSAPAEPASGWLASVANEYIQDPRADKYAVLKVLIPNHEPFNPALKPNWTMPFTGWTPAETPADMSEYLERISAAYGPYIESSGNPFGLGPRDYYLETFPGTGMAVNELSGVSPADPADLCFNVTMAVAPATYMSFYDIMMLQSLGVQNASRIMVQATDEGVSNLAITSIGAVYKHALGADLGGPRGSLYNTTSADSKLRFLVQPRPFISDGEFKVEGSDYDLFTYSLLGPLLSMTASLVGEKESRLRGRLRLCGVHMRDFYSSWWLTMVVQSLVSYTIFMVALLVTDVLAATENSPALYITLGILWSLAVPSVALFISTFFHSRRNVMIFMFLGVSFCSTCHMILDLVLSDTVMNILSILPPFALLKMFNTFLDSPLNNEIPVGVDGVSMVRIRTAAELFGATSDLAKEFWGAAALLMAGAVLCFLLAVYFDNVLKQPYEAPSSPLFPIAGAKHWWHKLRDRQERHSLQVSPNSGRRDRLIAEYGLVPDVLPIPGSVCVPSAPGDPDDVTAERARVAALDLNAHTPALVVADLHKKYGDFTAVHQLSFSVDEGECFGFCGANGSGKSTTIDCLSYAHEITGGTAYINGLSVADRKNKNGVFASIGVCPQVDVVWGVLNALEHFVIFNILRAGTTTWSAARADAEQLANRIGLTAVKSETKQCRRLSGGQRRRVSFGIALAGSPNVIVLDEPSTGIDPKTRRDIWALVADLKRDHAVVLTSHDMAECEVLCDRVCIMDKGRMQAIGSHVELANRLGRFVTVRAVLPPATPEEGFVDEPVGPGVATEAPVVTMEDVMLRTDDARIEAAVKLLDSVWPGATAGSIQGDSVQIRLPPQDVVQAETGIRPTYAALLATLENEGETVGISSYTVTSTTLHEVFLDIIKNDL